MRADLPSLAAAVHAPRSNAKPEPRKRTKGRKDRAESKVKTAVRAVCVSRDGWCRANQFVIETDGTLHKDVNKLADWDLCASGRSEWAHMHTKRRSQTRNQAPEVRHTTAASLMLCTFHHDQYDGRQKPRLFITALTRKGADGPLRFRRAK